MLDIDKLWWFCLRYKPIFYLPQVARQILLTSKGVKRTPKGHLPKLSIDTWYYFDLWWLSDLWHDRWSNYARSRWCFDCKCRSAKLWSKGRNFCRKGHLQKIDSVQQWIVRQSLSTDSRFRQIAEVFNRHQPEHRIACSTREPGCHSVHCLHDPKTGKKFKQECWSMR